MRLHEIDQFLALEEATPHVVPLPRWDNELHGAAKSRVAVAEQAGVFIDRNKGVDIAVNGEEWYAGPGERGKLIDGIVLLELGLKFIGSEFVGGSSLGDPWIAGKVANGINAGKCSHFVGVLGGPGECHESTATASQKDGFGRETARTHLIIEGREEFAAGQAAVGFTDIDAGDGDSGINELLKHP